MSVEPTGPAEPPFSSAAPGVEELPNAREQAADEHASLRQFASDVSAYARALGQLAFSEAALAKVNFTRLLLLALAVPAIVFGILLGVDALLAALALRLFGDITLAFASVLAVNTGLLVLTLLLLRRWWRSLSLPRSRAALAKAVEAFK